MAGFAAPQGEKERRIHVSFTLDYFKDHDVKTLAQETFKDWRFSRSRSAVD